MTKAKQSLKNLYDKIALHHVLGVLAFLYFFMDIYGLPKWALYKAKHHQDIYQTYACNMVKGKYNIYIIEIEGKSYRTSEVDPWWSSEEEKNNIPFVRDKSIFNKDKDKYMNKNNCFKIKYIQLWEWPLISYKKIYLYEYIP